MTRRLGDEAVSTFARTWARGIGPNHAHAPASVANLYFAWGIAFSVRLATISSSLAFSGRPYVWSRPESPSDPRGYSMQTAPTPSCPKCGSTNVKYLSEHQQFHEAGVFGRRLDTPIRTIYTYEC